MNLSMIASIIFQGDKQHTVSMHSICTDHMEQITNFPLIINESGKQLEIVGLLV